MVPLFTRGVVVLAATTLCFAFGAPAAKPDVGLQNVNLACNDGTNLAIALDATAVGALTNAVNAITLYPAGDPALSCALSQVDPPSGGNGTNPNKDFAVGGGRAPFVTRCTNPRTGLPEDDNFALNARVDKGALPNTATGTFNITIPECTSSQNTGGPTTYTSASHLNTRVDCLVVTSTGTDANLTATVTHATNLFANPNEVAFPPTRIAVHVHDSGLPGGMGDTIDWTPVATSDCQPTGSPPVPLDNGNISVHKAP
jgi:hypothetical protein